MGGRLWITHVQIFRLEKGRVGNDCDMNDVVERKVEHEAACTNGNGINIASRSHITVSR